MFSIHRNGLTARGIGLWIPYDWDLCRTEQWGFYSLPVSMPARATVLNAFGLCLTIDWKHYRILR